MIKLRHTMDSKSMDIIKDNSMIGSLQWHDEREPRIVINNFQIITISELSYLLDKYKEIKK